jgi:phosphotriesterase-related protein
MGSYLEFDLFGVECSHYQLNRKVDMPSDAQRINYLYQLIGEGYEDKLLISHDIHTKHRLVLPFHFQTEYFKITYLTFTISIFYR